MNYGWGSNTYNIWYTLDALPQGGKDGEHMFINIMPATKIPGSMGDTTFVRESFRYRYFTYDTTGSKVTFEPGQYLQFLPGITVTALPEGYIRFEGSSYDSNTLFFTRGDRSKGVRIYDGTLRLNGKGSIKFY
jgi:hypothetical protein